MGRVVRLEGGAGGGAAAEAAGGLSCAGSAVGKNSRTAELAVGDEALLLFFSQLEIVRLLDLGTHGNATWKRDELHER